MNREIEDVKKMDELVENIIEKIYTTMQIEGKINRVVMFGNSTMIEFENGRRYKQSFISLSMEQNACLDKNEVKDSCSHPNIGTDGGGDYCKKCGKRF